MYPIPRIPLRPAWVAAGIFGSFGLLIPVAAQKEPAEEQQEKLPGSTKSLGEYLANTVWDLEGGKVFRFRGDGTMVMP